MIKTLQNQRNLLDLQRFYHSPSRCRPPYEYFDGYGIMKGIEFIKEWKKKMENKKEIKL